MKYFVRKSSLSLIAISLLTSSLVAKEIDLTTHGRLSLGYFGNNSNFSGNGNNAPGLFGLNAYVKADFGLTEHLHIGMGAAGIWNVWSLFSYSGLSYTAIGDVADIYLTYKTDTWKLVVGRYDAGNGITAVPTNGFLNGHIQGISFVYNLGKSTKVWAHYVNSILNDGYLPGRIGSNLSTLAPYFSSGKATTGGEIFHVGADLGFKIGKEGKLGVSPWVLFSTKGVDGTTQIRFDPVVQVGAKARYEQPIFNRAWRTGTGLNLAFQYGNGTLPNDASDDFLGMVVLDEEIKYTRYRTNSKGKEYVDYSISFGLGARGIIAKDTGRYYAGFFDGTRFYGKFLNGAAYGQGGTWTVYAFGKMEHRLFDVHLFLGGGSYSEVSIIGDWKAYRQNRESDEGRTLGFDVGLGYSFASGKSAANHGFMLFAKLFY